MSQTIGTYVRMLGSRRFATALIIAWACLLVIWVIPFEFYGLPRDQIKEIIYGELFFRLVYGLVALSTLGCILPRIPSAVRKALRVPSTLSRPRVPTHRSSAVVGAWDAAKARRIVAQDGYGHLVEGEGWVWGVRNRWSPLGSVAFHVSLLLLMLSVTLLLVPSSTFSASAVVAEGESFDSEEGVFSDRATPEVPPPPAAFTVRSIEPRFYKDLLLFTQLDSVLVDELGNTRSMSLAAPWIVNPMTLLAIEDFGYSLAVKDTVESSSSVPPQVYKLKAFPSSLSDSFDRNIGANGYRFTVRIFGDYIDRSGMPGTKSFNLTEPRIEVAVARVLSSGQTIEVVPARLVKPGDSIKVENGSVTFERVSYYGEYRLTRNLAAPFIFVSLLLLCVGTFARLLFPRREAVIANEDGGVFVAVNDEMYRTAPRAVESLRTAWEGSE